MSFKVVTTPNFDKEAKRLAKRWPSLRDDLGALFKELEATPRMGTALGNEVYKIRLRIASAGKGKSGGARVITVVRYIGGVVYPCSIYSKSDRGSVTDKELKALVKEVPSSR